MKKMICLALWGLVLMTLAACSAARSNYNEARDFEEQGLYEEAMYRYAEAFRIDPEAVEYRLRFLAVRRLAALKREKQGDELTAADKHAEAAAAYQAAAGIDGSEPRYAVKAATAIRLRDAGIAWQEGVNFKKTNKLREAAAAFDRAIELAPDNAAYKASAQWIDALRKSRVDGFELQLKSNQPITLRFRETRIKDIFSVISQLSGITFVFDPDFKDQAVTINLEKGTFRQAIDLLSSMHKLGHKILNETTMLVYPRNQDKIKQYEDLQLRTLHLNHLDAKKAVNLVRTMIQVKRIYVNQENNALVARDTRDVLDVVEKIIEANDLPEAEVVLDVEVIEVSDKNAKNVGLLLSNYNVQLGAFSPAPANKLLATVLKDTTTSSTGTVTTDATIDNLVRAFSINSFGGYVTVPNAQYNFGKTLTNGEVLSNPKIRVRNREKAKFNVGTRVPITTATLATTGTLSQTNVQYVDVGIKVNAEPTIQLNNEVVIKLGLEVSSIIARETVGGKDSPTTVVTIGTRNLDTVLSLKDGETSVIGGLISRTASDSTQKVFLLGDIPLLGPLLSNTETSKDKTELILAITPRLVRGVTMQGRRLTSFNSGREDEPSLRPPYASFELEPLYEEPEQKKPADRPSKVPSPPTTPPTAPQQTTPAASVLPPLRQLSPTPAQPTVPPRRPPAAFRQVPQRPPMQLPVQTEQATVPPQATQPPAQPQQRLRPQDQVPQPPIDDGSDQTPDEQTEQRQGQPTEEPEQPITPVAQQPQAPAAEPQPLFPPPAPVLP